MLRGLVEKLHVIDILADHSFEGANVVFKQPSSELFAVVPELLFDLLHLVLVGQIQIRLLDFIILVIVIDSVVVRQL
jgi:hypothetical protein